VPEWLVVGIRLCLAAGSVKVVTWYAPQSFHVTTGVPGSRPDSVSSRCPPRAENVVSCRLNAENLAALQAREVAVRATAEIDRN
jgi:hypothetical protein